MENGPMKRRRFTEEQIITVLRKQKARANVRWSRDFVHDQMAAGRRFRILKVVDDVTRECLACVADTSSRGRLLHDGWAPQTAPLLYPRQSAQTMPRSWFYPD